MRFVMTLFLWVLTTILLAAAVPSAWVQKNIIDQQGYSSFAAGAATDPRLQQAVAGELTTQVQSLAAQNGAEVDSRRIRAVAGAYTAGPDFPGQFALANQLAHTWMFTDRLSRDENGSWVIDVAPMLSDPSFRDTLTGFGVEVPQTLTVPIASSAPDSLRPGILRPLAVWGPWVSVGVTVLAGVFALLTLATARARGKALAALGISALLVGAAGWAGLEAGRRYLNEALNHTSGDIRQIADAMVGHAINSLHQWLNLTLTAGGALVAFGIFVAVLGGLRRKSS
ncbi:hypothetical protein [Mycolicibacterium fortuitum]|uniref:Uncharacterized protein n=2 Tax=Mycolicibacterium fortuitum TaxID=1766 RepID=A0A0N7H9H7_MYCFO|nr:hypothetical protein [Mycolicibacterium fortuitum]AIY48395.1 hypothetical protein G155_25955 [Mycobacterium sp. VKM Ac-1817D]ALI29055.1 hypothetical protein XA26_52630 [Mycolicibacterium fortuitum]AMD55852.1 hypothetical protein ATO49_24665 [Mycolicibacterium fortuitum subsp. fortuitum DSM 46621 = ATCC 6841 = JCM 6387]EJZ13960.1 hypothetical protein MFORT_11966 [Mycolicibacterium fortuitum subsp. fortuitum DSM 46621 = ATCC 6841 = JCM 6387]MBP3084907.1 hypothetical protein [Mycolicibacterium